MNNNINQIRDSISGFDFTTLSPQAQAQVIGLFGDIATKIVTDTGQFSAVITAVTTAQTILQTTPPTP